MSGSKDEEFHTGLTDSEEDEEESEEEDGEKKWDYTDSILFMDNPEDAMKTPEFAGLQSLLYDGPPNEVAENFKDQGNAQFQKKSYRNALVFYTKGIDTPDVSDIELACQLRNNRAQVHFFLENFGKCVEDCKFVLSHQGSNIKAHFRLASASLRLRKYDDCILHCRKGVLIAQAMEEGGEKFVRVLSSIRQKAETALGAETRRNLEKKDVVSVREQFLRDRGIVVSPKKELVIGSFSDTLMVDEGSGDLFFRVVFLYDEFHQSDVIERFSSKSRFQDELVPLLDGFPYGGAKGRSEFNIDRVRIFFLSLESGQFVEVQKNSPLEQVLTLDTYRLPADFSPVFHLVLNPEVLLS